MNVVIVHAHPERQSFSSALAKCASEVLTRAGHRVTLNDLYASSFDPVSGRTNFASVKDPIYFKQQQEEIYATEHNGFASELETEIRKLEAADLLVFSFPIWWFGMPAILKGWVDRVFAMGRVYGGSRLYEHGLGMKRGARAMVIMTTGAGETAYDGRGVNPALHSILAPINHGIFWFNGFRPLDPFVAWGAARVSDNDRRAYLELLRTRLSRIFDETPLELPRLADFPQFGKDRKLRFTVVVRRKQEPDEDYLAKIPAERNRVAELRRSGFITDEAFSPPNTQNWRGFLSVRAVSEDEVQSVLATLPLADRLDFEVYQTS